MLADVHMSSGGRNQGSSLPTEKHHSISKEGMFDAPPHSPAGLYF